MVTKLQYNHGRPLNPAADFTKPKKNNRYFWVFDFKSTHKAKSF
jgi:hypothetical protein